MKKGVGGAGTVFHCTNPRARTLSCGEHLAINSGAGWTSRLVYASSRLVVRYGRWPDESRWLVPGARRGIRIAWEWDAWIDSRHGLRRLVTTIYLSIPTYLYFALN